jgi:hypothetical protein
LTGKEVAEETGRDRRSTTGKTRKDKERQEIKRESETL